MPTTRSPKTTPRRAGATPRRQPGAPMARRPATPGLRRRKPEPQSNAKKVIGAVGSALPGLLAKGGKPAKGAKRSGKKGGAGLALGLAGAGFAAFKQRSAKKGQREVTVVAPASPANDSVAPSV